MNTKPASPPHRSDGDGSRLKPIFKVGTAVTAAWWPDRRSQDDGFPSSWRPGVVRSCRQTSTAGPYGPTRSYGIAYVGGDALDVAEHLVFTREDYDLITKNEGRSVWTGVKNVVDQKSRDLWGERFEILDRTTVCPADGPPTTMILTLAFLCKSASYWMV